MNFNIDGINVYLKINNYRHSNKENWDSLWCNCDFMFNSGDWLNYHRENDEIFLCSEIEELESVFTMLLNGEISEDKELSFIEPDFVFNIYPIKDIQNSVSDILIEWRVYFWHEGLTDNYLSITLDRDEIIKLRDYLSSIIRKR
ncbi:MAG: hypothetical protein E7516_02830 [Ruminococcaceae bacterium]|nr:hypothetical protein [Oscillospiraceae bacterium]